MCAKSGGGMQQGAAANCAKFCARAPARRRGGAGSRRRGGVCVGGVQHVSAGDEGRAPIHVDERVARRAGSAPGPSPRRGPRDRRPVLPSEAARMVLPSEAARIPPRRGPRASAAAPAARAPTAAGARLRYRGRRRLGAAPFRAERGCGRFLRQGAAGGAAGRRSSISSRRGRLARPRMRAVSVKVGGGPLAVVTARCGRGGSPPLVHL